jgi:hypothetical protein
MSINAYLPCLICNKVLPNVAEDCDNQPHGGTVFRTEGHYGSTMWDSFDGEDLVLTVCDECLRARTERLGQQKRYLPVRTHSGISGLGRYWVGRPLVAYTGCPDTDVLLVGEDELGELAGVEWVSDIAERQAALQQ